MHIQFFCTNKIFTHPFYGVIFIVLFWFYFLSEVFIIFKTRKNSKGKMKKDSGSYYLIIAFIYINIAIDLYVSFLENLIAPIFQLIGLFLFFTGIIFRLYAVKILDKAFTLKVYTGDKQKIIKKFPYNLIRHPAYLGSIITMIGIALSLRNIVNIFITILIQILMYLYRIKIEEKELIKRFGKEYIDYKKMTRALIPFIF